jgi:membrane protein implicated in regulation of membrane protease activity
MGNIRVGHMKQFKLINKLAEIKIRLDRGNALIYWFRNIIIIVAGLKFLIELSLNATIIMGIILIVILYFLGWLDLNIIKLFQKEAELNTGKYNPYFKRTLG